MQFAGRKTSVWLSLTLLTAAMASGCSWTSASRAPVEDLSAGVARAPGAVDPATLPGYENAGKPGFYSVRPGDTIMRIATEVNQPWRDIARWNNLDNPNVIEVGQVLRVVPPAGSVAPAVAATEPVRSGSSASAAPVSGTKSPPVPVATQVTPGSAATPAPPAPEKSPPPSAGGDSVDFIWPANGTTIAGFDEAKNKGLGIAGKAGDPVLAAADGKVVYAGAGLRGYGNLIILKHNNTFLTAYAHNQTLLVKEDQNVKKGQKIAEMGSTDSDRVKLHFEIRRSGKPVDPARYLPPR